MTLRDALRLIYVVDEEIAANTDHLACVLEAGVSMLWLRCIAATGRRLSDIGKDLRALTERHGRALVVGDRLDVAAILRADGVHVGHRAPPASALRPHAKGWLGVSCHSAAELKEAESAGADYATLSPVHTVPGKGAPLGPRGFGRLRRGVEIPVVALGGIDLASAPEAIREGADGLAVIRALRDARDPADTAERLYAEVTSS